VSKTLLATLVSVPKKEAIYNYVTPSPVSPSPYQGEGEYFFLRGATPLLNTPCIILGFAL